MALHNKASAEEWESNSLSGIGYIFREYILFNISISAVQMQLCWQGIESASFFYMLPDGDGCLGENVKIRILFLILWRT